ncbi:MAG: alkylation response protein AidB-like acyl-CoA dehydrogenase, partial [Gammaproteobacteria bacterium]
MDLNLNEDLEMIRDMARDFANSELLPRATQHDRNEAIDPDVFGLISELGFWGMTIPEEHGGVGLDSMALALVLMEINRACASTGVTVSVHNSLVGSPVVKHGSEAQKAEWLPKLASGEVMGAYCLTEAHCGSDAAAIKTSAVKDADGWLLNGTKMWVTNAGWAKLFIVYARTNPDVPGTKGLSCFLVSADAPGVSVGKKELKTGIRGSSTHEVIFENVRLAADSLLGMEGRGFHIAMDTLDGGRIGIAAQAVGIAQACLAASIKYANEREQFGRTIGNFAAIQHKLADMSVKIEGSRLLVLRAAQLRDSGAPCSKEAAQAKLAASQGANWCADECLQIHGGAGYTDDFHVERLFRDARITEIYEGATDIQRLV